MNIFRSLRSTPAMLQRANAAHERLMEQYVREPLRHTMWRHDCEMVDRYNATGAQIEKLTFDEWKRVGESTNSGANMPDAQRTVELPI